MRTRDIPAPEHLSDPSGEFWRKVQTTYGIRDEAGLRLLRLACECLDAAEAARLAVAEHGQVYADRFGAPRLRPEVKVQRDSMLTFARLTRELGLDIQGK